MSSMTPISITNYTFNPYSVEIDGLSVITIDISNFPHYKPQIDSLINHFNQRYNWDGMFDIEEVEKRLSDNKNLYLLFYKEVEIGYIWIKEIETNTCFSHNLFVRKNIERPKDAPIWFISKVYENCLHKYETVELEIDDWNFAALKIHYSILK